MLQTKMSDLRNQPCKVFIAFHMDSGCTFMLCHSNSHHLHQAAFIITLETGVWFDLIDDDDPV